MPISSALSSIATALRPRKGDQTRAAIVDVALAMASREGLEGLTIGTLADRMQMSKSGVFAHFGSREELQLAVLNEYVRRFVNEVLRPAVKKPRGLPRLEAIAERWVAFLARELTRGCIMIAGAFEYDDRPGPQRDAMVEIIAGWNAELLKAIRQARNASGCTVAALGRQCQARARRAAPTVRRCARGAERQDPGFEMPCTPRGGGSRHEVRRRSNAVLQGPVTRPAVRSARSARCGRRAQADAALR